MITEKVDAYRAKHNDMSVREFERLCGLPNGTVNKWYRKGFNPRLETLQKVAVATKTSVRSWL